MHSVEMGFTASTETENELLLAFARGELLDLTSREDGEKTVHAGILGRLLRTGQSGSLKLAGAEIHGELDLEYADVKCPVILTDCTFDHQVRLADAKLRSLSLRECSAPGIDAEHLRVGGDLRLEHLRLTGTLCLRGAHVDDDLHLKGAHLDVPDGDALVLTGIDVKGKIDADNLRVDGKITMNDATVTGPVSMKQATIEGKRGEKAWDADGLSVGGELDASELKVTGQVSLLDAQVLGLVFNGAELTGPGTALQLDRLRARGSVFCCGSEITGLRGISMQIGGSLYLRGARVTAPAGGEHVAVDLSRSRITDNLDCRNGLQATGKCKLTDIHVGGAVLLEGATLRNPGGAAIDADRAQVGIGLICRDGFTCVGEIKLMHAGIGGDLTIVQSGKGGPGNGPVTGQGLTVAKDLLVRTSGTVDLRAARIGGKAELYLEHLAGSDDQAAADLSDATAGDLALHGAPDKGVLDLSGASVRCLHDCPEKFTGHNLLLDGFEYDGLADADLDQRLDWVRAGNRRVHDKTGGADPDRFALQPYRQLASFYQRTGKDQEARRVLRAMYHDRDAALPWKHNPPRKVWGWIQDRAIGYGYAPSIALRWLLALVVVGTVLFSVGTGLTVIRAAILTLGLMLPGVGFSNILKWPEMNDTHHALAAGLLLAGLTLGATVVAAVTRYVKR
ncbi:hypothetical protein [Amycolatopsis sp. NPDC059657]|uniref:hypothetical protein n=1 Tax=Amycolatopsis sp. NPDC059657 TaxID=3346899 RepID=UPI00366CD338